MATMGSSAWDGQDHGLHPTADDDFQQFLDMNGMGNLAEGLQFDFADFQNASHGHDLNPPTSGADTPHAATTGPSHPTTPSTMMPPPAPTDAISEIDAQIQYLQQQRLQRQMEEQQAAFFSHQRRMVPPTPQSLELQAGSQFYTASEQQNQQQAMFEQYQRLKEQQEMAFTPLVSPAVTPLETQFPLENRFTIPGAYFSPLTSPALHAENEASLMFDARPTAGNSPGDVEMEPVSTSAPVAADLAKKGRKNTAAKARKGGVRQSPISKPQRKKSTTTPVMNAQALDQLAETFEGQERLQQQLPPPAPQTSVAVGATDSENGSISPEALTDMPPPPIPKPRSARPSPYMQPQNHAATPTQQFLPGQPSPATPASLMKLPSPRTNKSSSSAAQETAGGGGSESIETFELPESLNISFHKTTPPLPATKSQTASPSIEATSTNAQGFQPLPPPAFAKPSATASASPSPQLTPGPPSCSARKTPQMPPRSSKKRSSVSSAQASPALRPKISPNIKPLLPSGANAEDHTSRLLASKSNYQNILEGNTVPGVSYPSELSTNLTSKRTSHKIAEQGRRNRINSALHEIATLLPKPPPTEGRGSEEEGGDKKDKQQGGGGPNSKASTVEMAIEYIKQLQEEVAEANKRAREAERKLEMGGGDA